MIDMTLEMAETAMKAAQAKARALRAPMTITVVDEAGRLVLTARGDGMGFFSPETSRAKAMAAASFKKRTARADPADARRLADHARRAVHRRHRLRRWDRGAGPGVL